MEVTKKYKDLGPLIKFFNMRWNWPVSVRGNWEDILKKKEFPDPNISWPNSSQHASALAVDFLYTINNVHRCSQFPINKFIVHPHKSTFTIYLFYFH